MKDDSNDNLSWLADIQSQVEPAFQRLEKRQRFVRPIKARVYKVFKPLLPAIRNPVVTTLTGIMVGAVSTFTVMQVDGFNSKHSDPPTTDDFTATNSQSLAPNRIAPIRSMLRIEGREYELDTSYQTLDMKINGVSNLVEADAVLYNVDKNGRRLKAGVEGGPELYVSEAAFLQNGENSAIVEQKDGCGLTPPGDSFKSTENAETVGCQTTNSLVSGDYLLTVEIVDAGRPGLASIPEPFPVHFNAVGR